jgi:hypothetical protein
MVCHFLTVFKFFLNRFHGLFHEGKFSEELITVGVKVDRLFQERVTEEHRDILVSVNFFLVVLFKLVVNVADELANSACLDVRQVELILSQFKYLFLAGVKAGKRLTESFHRMDVVLRYISIDIHSEKWHLGDMLELGRRGVTGPIWSEKFNLLICFVLLNNCFRNFVQSGFLAKIVLASMLLEFEFVAMAVLVEF